MPCEIPSAAVSTRRRGSFREGYGMSEKNKFLRFTKRQRANLIDIFTMFVCTIAIFFAVRGVTKADIPWFWSLIVSAVYTTLYFVFIMISRINRIMWEHATGRTFMILSLDVCCSALATYLIFLAVAGAFDLRFLLIMCCVLFGSYFVIMLSKFVILEVYDVAHRRVSLRGGRRDPDNNTLIVGAGWTGTALVREFKDSDSIFNPVCLVDDDPEKADKTVMDLPVAGTTADIDRVVRKYNVKKILFAIPTCEKEKRKKLIADCLATKCVVKVVPPMQELVDKSDVTPAVRNVNIEDLLGREPAVFDMTEVAAIIRGKRVLVTGGGGSIGSELCRQIASFGPERLVILDIYENNAYDIQQELLMKYPGLNLSVEICSIADLDKCRLLFDRYRPQLVYHAAAHKHVPLMEHVPEQAVKNNVVGTLNLCGLALEFGVERFLLVSTDKAVNPTNVMGATKRCCEKIVKYHAQRSSGTVFCAVRFGNVLGSNGSVIPLFKRQIAAGGPVTLTHRDIIRYFMTIPEAVSLLLETSCFSKNGEIFVLDMGEPVKILDLAENVIRLSGFTPYADMDIVFTGLRPGEKLFEELLVSGEDVRKTSNKKIFVCKQVDVDEETFPSELDALIACAKANRPDEVRERLRRIVPTYHTEPDARM